ncbi:MAG: hypothetical protein ACO25F_09415 [Erythrobacter sp.]
MVNRLDPAWLAHRYDESNDTIRFVRYERHERAAVPFLIDGLLPSREFQPLSRSEARQQAGDAPVHFIFHSGFCCSTLLAAALDQPGLASSFSEPTILNDAIGWRLRGAPVGDVGELVDDALRLLGRPFAGDPASILKPSTVVNGLAEAMLAIRPQARAVLMYAPLRDFLISIAKKGLEGRLWVRDLLLKCRAERRTEVLGFSDYDLLGQTDLQVAALDWLMQQAVFARLVERFPDRVRSLSSESFLGQPEETIRLASALFGLPLKPENVASAMNGAMRQNSKDGSPFGPHERRKDYDAAYRAHADEVDKVLVWAEHVAKAAGLTMSLPEPLIHS